MVIKPEELPATKMIKSRKRKSMEVSKDSNSSPSSSKSAKSNGKVGGSGGGQLVEGMSLAETIMIRRLAGNDPQMRLKTFKKLRKWLNTLAKRSPDNQDCRQAIEPNLIRVWKALFYCMWMADKPLPQEQLAEQISEFVSIFVVNPPAFQVFVEWFFRTLAREWSWIDRLRLDKFMMLTRRFLRKTFKGLADLRWKVEVTDPFLATITTYIFNHEPPTSAGKKNGTVPVDPIARCPVGLQIHFISIFMEELAKAGADTLKSTKIIKLLSPFITELATNDDTRITDEIRQHIFVHLMKQSDVGIDYQDALLEEEQEEEDEEIEDEEVEYSEEELENEENGQEGGNPAEDDIYEANAGPLDPRAGAVDVILPQLNLDYSILAEKLVKAGGQKLVKKRNRGLLYSLAGQLREITQGSYPLALPEQGPNKPAIPNKDVKRATKRYLEDEAAAAGPKFRMTKKQRKREAKKAREEAEEPITPLMEEGMEALSTVSSPETESPFLEWGMEASLLTRSEVDSAKPKIQLKRKGMKALSAESEGSVEPTTPLKKKRMKVSLTGSEDSAEPTTPLKNKNMRASLTGSDGSVSAEPKSPLKRKGMKTKLAGIEGSAEPKTPLMGNGMKVPSIGSEGSAARRKRVSFILAKNLEHEATDYMGSIERSPAVPYDPTRTPTVGLLKPPGSKTTPNRTKLTSSAKKRTLLDFDLY